MKEIIVKAWCDNPLGLHDDRKKSDEEQRVTVEGKALTLDCCNGCLSEMRSLLAHWIEIGSPVQRRRDSERQATPARQPAPSGVQGRRTYGLVEDTPDSWRTCPECRVVSPTRSALGQHMRSKHDGLKLSAYEWDYDPREAKKEALSNAA